MRIPFPFRGVDKSRPTHQQSPETSPNMNNMRLFDTLDGRARGGQRPGLDKWGSGDQIGAGEPIVAMCSVATIESNLGGDLQDALITGDTDKVSAESGSFHLQEIVPTKNYRLTKIALKLYKSGTVSNSTVRVYPHDSVNDRPDYDAGALTTESFDGDSLTTNTAGEWIEITLSTPINLTANTHYYIAVVQGAGSPTLHWRVATNNPYTPGSVWGIQTGSPDVYTDNVSTDTIFRCFGFLSDPIDKVIHKKLIMASGNEIWKEYLAGKMEELTAANGDIDTTDQLNMFELFQKVFIVNGSNLKVADFINTKLSTADIRPNDTTNVAPMHGTVLTGGTSTAIMVVDYCNANNGAALIYGYVISGLFQDAEVVTGTNADGTPTAVSFTTDTAPVDNPHWYDWTVYPTIGGISFGTMPNKAYLGCNYRGRAVLSGDPEHPHQWYMARQGNPWDFAYVANDAQSPVRGGDADYGEIGDIVKAIISYKDDYLIHGCITSVWFNAGDPCEGGTLNELDLTVGMYGANSWCFDGLGNLFFWGTNGIYVTTIPGTPKCISEQSLPELVKDEDADPSTHRITIAYDRTRTGILICILTLSDGTNSNYFYDLKSNGFFPEVYPEECGPYSLFYYTARDNNYRDLLVGCKDGYIRKFDDSAVDDDIGGSDEAIDSYVTFGPVPMTQDPKLTGKLTGLDCVTAGGAASGSQSDSDDITYDVFVGNSAEEVIEKLSADTNPNIAGTIKAPGRRRGSIIHRKVKGVYMGIKLQNDTAAETWGFEQLLIDLKQSGRLK